MIFDNETQFSKVLSPSGYNPFNNQENKANNAKIPPLKVDLSVQEMKGTIQFKLIRTSYGYSEVMGYIGIEDKNLIELAPFHFGFANNIEEITLHFQLFFHSGVVDSVSTCQVHKLVDDVERDPFDDIQAPLITTLPMFYPTSACPDTNRIQQLSFIEYRLMPKSELKSTWQTLVFACCEQLAWLFSTSLIPHEQICAYLSVFSLTFLGLKL